MTQKFFITGLPRSRTAWFSILCSGYNSICHHEPTEHGQWEDVCAGIWNFSSAEYTGISDSALGFNCSEILKEHQPKTLIVVREKVDVMYALGALGIVGVDKYLSSLSGRFIGVAHNPLVKLVDYNRLNELEVVTACMDWLMPGGVGHGQRAKWFMPFNIQKVLDWEAAEQADLRDMIGEDAHAEFQVN